MFVPFISKRSSSRLFRRKGGGGKGSSSGKGSIGSKPTSPSKGTTKGTTSPAKTGSITSSSVTRKTTTYDNPIVAPRVIPAGQPYTGRMEGGAGRTQIFGTRIYGSGYPGTLGRGTAGRGFPFIFWPISWPLIVGGGIASAAYLHNQLEYGEPTNSSRPGGALTYATFPSNSTNPPTIVFRVLGDNSTIISLIDDLSANCSSYLSTSSSPPNALSTKTSGSTPFLPPYTFSNTTGPANPQPEQVIQYFRASTIALTLDSYNNSATYSTVDGAPDTPLPVLSDKDMALMTCLNETIGLAAPLFSSGRIDIPMSPALLLWIVWLLWALL